MRAVFKRSRQRQPLRSPRQPEAVMLGLRIVHHHQLYEWDLCPVNWLEEMNLLQTVGQQTIRVALELQPATIWVNLCSSPDDASPRTTWFAPLRAGDWRPAKIFKQPPHDDAHCRLRILRIDRPRA